MNTSSLALGSHAITAVYSGDGTYSGGTSGVITQVVNRATPVVTLATSGTPVNHGTAVTFTAAVSTTSNVAPTGLVAFYDAGVAIGAGQIGGGAVTMTTSGLMTGTHTITARYYGDTNFVSVASSALTQVIGRVGMVLPGPGIINTFASNGIAGYSGDAGGPDAVALDSQGNVYIVDRYSLDDSLYSHLLRVTASTGAISTVAGVGPAGYSGDGGPATHAQIDPRAIAIDGVGNIYLSVLNQIRMVNASTGVISTIAGNGSTSPSSGGTFSGDGGPAANAGLNTPTAMATDGANNLYFIDSGNYRIRKVTASTGIISTVAGNGAQGYSGDGGAATSAELYVPAGIALDKSGNIYIADAYAKRLRMVNVQTGVISTVAGNGIAGYPGDGDGGAATDAEISPYGVAVDSAGNLYISDASNNAVRMITASTGIISTIAGNGSAGYSGDGGPAISAELNMPAGVAVDSASNVYIADWMNYAIRVVGTSLPLPNVSVSCAPGVIVYGSTTTCTATVTGSSPTGTVMFTYNGYPWTSCTLASGTCSVSGLSELGGGFYNISGSYYGDGNNAAASGSGSLTVYEETKENGPSTATISISDLPSSAKIGGSFTVAYSYSGDGLPMVASSTPGVCTVSGNLVSFVSVGTCTLQASATATTNYTAATGSAQTFTVSILSQQITLPTSGNIDTIAGNGTFGYSGDGGAAISAEMCEAGAVALDTAGNIYFVDICNDRIRKVTASTGVISTIAGNGTEGYSGDGGPATNAELNPFGVAVDIAGNIYIADQGNQRIRKVTASTGVISTIAGNGTAGYSGDGGPATNAELNYPAAVTVDKVGNIYVADKTNNRIRKVTASTGVISTIAGNGTAACYAGCYSGDGGPATSAELEYPRAVTVDNLGNIYIVDSDNGLVREVSALTGIISTVAGKVTACDSGCYSGDGGPAISAELNFPFQAAVDSAGNIYIADQQNNRIRKVTASTGVISTIAGNGTEGYSGDGGPAISAELSSPLGVAVDLVGNIYIADSRNEVIRAVGAFEPVANVAISCSSGAMLYGSTATCTAAVTGFSPTGTVTFTYNGTFWASCTLSSGSCSLSGLNSLVGGSYIIAGNYPGDANNAAASGSTNLIVARATPTVTLASSGSPSISGQLVTFTATVTSDDANPVTFYNGSTALGTATPSNGTATLATTSLPVGSNTITASIAAGGDYDGATFTAITQTVTAAGQSDTGTVTLQVNGSTVAQTTYGAGSTPSSIAQGLAAGASSPLVNVSAADNSLYIQSPANSAGTAYPYSVVISDSAGFSQPSFLASPSSGTLQGAAGAGSGSGQTIYSYCVSGSSTNCNPSNGGYDSVGNLLGYSDSVMGTWSFSYDSLNRLISGIPPTGTSFCWSYDSFGNRTAESSVSGACPTLPTLPTATATYNTHNQITWTAVNAATSGLFYDAAGNVSNDNANTVLYDGEGRICALMSSAAHGVRVMTGYLYDAEGTRVAKGTITSMSCDPAVNGFRTTSDYVLGVSGEQVTEVGVDPSGRLTHQHTNVWAGGKLLATYDNDGLHFYLDDPLGTRRVQTDYAGSVEQQCASWPYGNGETCSSTPTEHLFTGKERDNESGLDYFGARYYASNMGRWMSPDWADKPEAVPYSSLDNPQSLNLYGYVGNNPLSRADADGHQWPDCDCIPAGGWLHPSQANYFAGKIVDGLHALGQAASVALSSFKMSPMTIGEAGAAIGSVTAVPAAPIGASTPSADKPSTLAPGPHAGDSIPARSPQRDFNQGERDATNAAGAATGCHTCGTMDPGTKTGNFVPDHQPVSSLNPTGAPQRLYPQCLGCSRTQGGEANAAKPKPSPPPQQPKPQGQQ